MSATETANRIAAGVVYDGVADQILAGVGVAAVVRDSAGVYRITTERPFELERCFPLVWPTDLLNQLYATCVQSTETEWLVVVTEPGGVAADVPRLTWRLGELPVV